MPCGSGSGGETCSRHPACALPIRGFGFADGFTHASEGGARAAGVATSLCAVLLAEACNTGFEPLIRRDNAALRRSRLSWVRQNYIRAETLTRTNAILVAAQNRIPLARAWGGGDVASADGLRFVVPVRTIHSGPNPRYYGQERGVTFYNLVSDQFTGLNGITVPGTLRDSLTLLSVVLEQQTELQPTEIMSDTGAYTDTIFGIFHLLGYQFSPRLADIGGTRFWRVDGKADYGALDELAAQRINVKLIVQHWEDLLRLAGSLKLGTVQAAGLIRTPQTKDRPTKLARALEELGRLIKTLYLLRFIDDEAYRRRILVQLNRGEGRHQLARVVFHGKRGELRQRYREGQEVVTDDLDRRSVPPAFAEKITILAHTGQRLAQVCFESLRHAFRRDTIVGLPDVELVGARPAV